jgi:hypothetical protein
VGIDGTEAALGQFLRQASADDGGTVQTQNGVHRGIIDKGSHHLLGNILRFAEAGLGICNINVVIDMAVVGGEVAASHSQGHIAALYRQVGNLNHSRILHRIDKRKAFPLPAAAFSPDCEKRFFSL